MRSSSNPGSDELPVEAFLEAIEDARQAASRDHGLELRWIFDIPADFGRPAAELTASVEISSYAATPAP